MAKKRLNKKVALLGASVLAVLLLGAILVVLRLSRDPEKFIADGDAAVAMADKATDQQVKKEEYEKAALNYLRAAPD